MSEPLTLLLEAPGAEDIVKPVPMRVALVAKGTSRWAGGDAMHIREQNAP